MDSELQGALSVLMKRVESKAQELTELKRSVNSFCRDAGMEPPYADADTASRSINGIPFLKSDQFYTKTPTVAAREYLDMRETAVPLEEILEALVRGGFDFGSVNWSPQLRLKNLGISLGKNSSIFHRLPNQTIGLTKWYDFEKGKKANGEEIDE